MKIFEFDYDTDKYEFLTSISKFSNLKVVKHYYEGRFFGYNLYAIRKQKRILIDGSDNKKYLKWLRKQIKKAINDNIETFLIVPEV